MGGTASDSGQVAASLSPAIQQLLHRKLSHHRRQFKADRVRRRAAVSELAWKQVQEYVPESNTRRGRGDIFHAVFGRIVDIAVEATEEWPESVARIISETIDSTNALPENYVVLQHLLDEYTWRTAEDAFTLQLLDSAWLQEYLDRLLGHFGLAKCDSEPGFSRIKEMDLVTSEISVINAAREAKEPAEIMLQECFLRNSSSRQQGDSKSATTRHNSASSVAGRNVAPADCLTNPPKKKNEWYLAIHNAVAEFIIQHNRCPKPEEIWIKLRRGQPESFGVRAGDHFGDEAVFIDDKALSKRAFRERWKRYSASGSGQTSKSLAQKQRKKT